MIECKLRAGRVTKRLKTRARELYADAAWMYARGEVGVGVMVGVRDEDGGQEWLSWRGGGGGVVAVWMSVD